MRHSRKRHGGGDAFPPEPGDLVYSTSGVVPWLVVGQTQDAAAADPGEATSAPELDSACGQPACGRSSRGARPSTAGVQVVEESSHAWSHGQRALAPRELPG